MLDSSLDKAGPGIEKSCRETIHLRNVNRLKVNRPTSHWLRNTSGIVVRLLMVGTKSVFSECMNRLVGAPPEFEEETVGGLRTDGLPTEGASLGEGTEGSFAAFLAAILPGLEGKYLDITEGFIGCLWGSSPPHAIITAMEGFTVFSRGLKSVFGRERSGGRSHVGEDSDVQTGHLTADVEYRCLWFPDGRASRSKLLRWLNGVVWIPAPGLLGVIAFAWFKRDWILEARGRLQLRLLHSASS